MMGQKRIATAILAIAGLMVFFGIANPTEASQWAKVVFYVG